MAKVPKGQRISRPAATTNSCHAGISGDTNPPPVRKRKSQWEITLIESVTIKQLEGHPLDGMGDVERQKTRCAVLGQVLAAIACRQNELVDYEIADSTMRQEAENATEKNNN